MRLELITNTNSCNPCRLLKNKLEHIKYDLSNIEIYNIDKYQFPDDNLLDTLTKKTIPQLVIDRKHSIVGSENIYNYLINLSLTNNDTDF